MLTLGVREALLNCVEAHSMDSRAKLYVDVVRGNYPNCILRDSGAQVDCSVQELEEQGQILR
jgi:hypothetical protein